MKIGITENQFKLLKKNLNEDYPSNWDVEYFKTLKSFNDRIKYCKENLQQIGSGTSRIAYKINEQKVLKLAKNKKGIAQNRVEVGFSNDSYFNTIVAEILNYDDDFLWVEMELARKVTPTIFKNISGFEFEDFADAINYYYHDSQGKSTFDLHIPNNYDEMWENDFVYNYFNVIGGYSHLPIGDFLRLSSYGLVKRDYGDDIVLVDYGLDSEVLKMYNKNINESIDDYRKWKRKNVTLRGIKEFGKPNEVYGSFGNGLYTVPLGNKSMAKQYGNVYFVVNAIPKNPKVVDSLNTAEIFIQKVINNFCKENGKDYSRTYFEKNTTIEDEIKKMGYDGVVIKGREMVNFNPENVKYFKTEDQLIRYYDSLKENI